MDLYISCLICISFYIAWVIFINHLTFKKSLVYYLFILAYSFAIIPKILPLIDYYIFGRLDFFYFYWDLLNPFLTSKVELILKFLILNELIVIYFMIIGLAVILSRFIPYAIEKFRERKENKVNIDEELISYGTALGLYLDYIEEKEKKEK